MNKAAIALGIVAVVIGAGVAVAMLMPGTFTAMLSAVQTLQVPATPPPAAPPAATEPPRDSEACDRLLAQVLSPSTPLEEFDRIEAELLRNNCGG